MACFKRKFVSGSEGERTEIDRGTASQREVGERVVVGGVRVDA